MSGHIPKHFIDELLTRVDITDIIDNRVPLKKAGRNMVACCPFHDEKTPSFTVSPVKQFYHCFGCGAHGTAINFLMEYDHLEFPDAIEALAASISIEVPRENTYNKSQVVDTSYEILQQAADYYKQQLKSSQLAIEYLKSRGISGQTASTYMIGYAPDMWDGLVKKIGAQHKDQLISTGMINENDNGRLYDRFRNRIIFPIRDQRGRVIAFGGRVLKNSDKPKYLNSPETKTFHKSRELYGLYELRKQLPRPKEIIVVEGYMDVASLAEHGVLNCVATLGTATTHEHLIKLLRITHEVIFCFDGDIAGNQAAWRALENTLPVLQDGYQFKFLFLPEGEDPDSLIRKNSKEYFAQCCTNAKSLSDYLFDTLKQKADISTIDGRAKLAELAKPYIQKVKNTVFRALLIKHLSQLVGLAEDKLWQHQANQNIPTHVTRPKQQSNYFKIKMNPIRLAIAALIEQPELANCINDLARLKTLQQPGVNLFTQMAELLLENPELSPPALLQRYKDTEHEKALSILAAHQFVLDTEAGNTIKQLFKETLNKLLNMLDKQRYEELIHKQQALTPAESDELRSLSIRRK